MHAEGRPVTNGQPGTEGTPMETHPYPLFILKFTVSSLLSNLPPFSPKERHGMSDEALGLNRSCLSIDYII